MIKVQKTLSLSEVELKSSGEGGALTFEGYASTFGNVDSYGDTILKGAYANVINSGSMPKMFFNHKSWELPIGKWLKMQEDDHGLFMKGELTPGLSISSDVAAAMRHQTLDGLSVGFGITKSDYFVQDDVRFIKNITLLKEVSPVIFPADDSARVDLSSIKSELESLESLKDLEHFLRDAGGFSINLSKALVSRAVIIAKREASSDNDDSNQQVKGEIVSLAESFKLQEFKLL